MREVILAEHSGFCFGVRRALKITNETIAARQDGDGRIYTCGPLIHNKIVTDELAEQGVTAVDGPSDAAPGDTVIVRSHGQTEAFYIEAKERDLNIVDATCPFVARIHELVREASNAGRNIIIVGDENHPEVRGIMGWAGDHVLVVRSPEEIKDRDLDKITVVSQTTMIPEIFEAVVAAIKEKTEDLVIHNTICNATVLRQEGCRKTAQSVDLMLVIGDKSSSNTKKLYEISQQYCPNTFFIERKLDLPLKRIEKCNRIGVAAGASTPERIIKEVISVMSEEITKVEVVEAPVVEAPVDEIAEDAEDMQALMDQIEKSLKRMPGRGEVITGKIFQVTDKAVMVSFGCKKDGILPIDEITLEEGQTLADLFKEGDSVQVKVIKTDDGEGSLLLSKKKLEVTEHWDEIGEALENKAVINAKVVKEVRGGVIAVYKEVSGFIPLSQLSDKFVEKADEFVGKTLPVKVSRVDPKRNKAVFSHKAYLAEEKQKRVQEIWDSINVGDIVEGTVMRFTDYGAFVDVGGVDGLLHISEISWGKLKHPQEALEIGQKIPVKILSMNAEKGKISLGLKQNTPEPWSVIDEKYAVGQVIEGKVVQIKEYGAFVELEPGLDGLVHISEIAHKRVTNIADEISVGQVLSAKILEIDKGRRRISLSIKETIEAPEAVEEAPAEEAPAADEE
ncbi:MAG: bifunctional 4-hydroxy-3-methylbut-2-enyl diphosphate reductase/30S ribosomal protein S1 [Clostridiales bacterium]|nr:bifunctional 4-hydroxy-3-methylbut-2-enyl diphosphate reductase/30S ribosomal protein S1 [Clostridiales bacterium]